jgi:putative transposase
VGPPVVEYNSYARDSVQLEILLNGVSSRRYQRVIPAMADTVGVSRSTVSRETTEASAAALQQLLERRFDES